MSRVYRLMMNMAMTVIPRSNASIFCQILMLTTHVRTINRSKIARPSMLFFKAMTLCQYMTRGELIMIIGPVGSGKTSLVEAVLGSMSQLTGSTFTPDAPLAYVSQKPWLQNRTIRQNIVFDADFEFDIERYRQVLEKVELTKDLDHLIAGDATEIGPNGLNLSGGQQQRVCLARALYQRQSSCYLLDDPLSALDIRVANRVFHQALVRADMCSTTRLLILNAHYHLLAYADRILVMQHGSIAAQGSLEEIQTRCPELLLNFTTDINEEEAHPPKPAVEPRKPIDLDTNIDEGRLTKREDRETGAVTFQTYLTYFQCSGYRGEAILAVIIILFTWGQACQTSSDWYISAWAQDQVGFEDPHLLGYCTLVLFTTGCVACRSFVFVKISMWSSIALHKEMLSKVLFAPLPSFFDTTPVGRIINRFSQDLDHVDSQLPMFFVTFLQFLFQVLAIFVVCAISSPWTLLIVFPLLLMFRVWSIPYAATSRELRRLEGVARSPIVQSLAEAFHGATILHAFGLEEQALRQLCGRLNHHHRYYQAYLLSGRWLALRLDLVAVVLISVITTGVLVLPTTASGAGLALVYAMQLTSFCQRTVWLGNMTENTMTSVERLMHFQSLDREGDAGPVGSLDERRRPVILARGHYLVTDDEQSEPSLEMIGVEKKSGKQQNMERHEIIVIEEIQGSEESKNQPPQQDVLHLALKDDGEASSWPRSGAIRFEHVYLRYRPGLPWVLRNLSLSIQSQEKIGICGRTGSGKSSLISALFRLVECHTPSSIYLDHVDISSISLLRLRAQLSMIPQHPVLFRGTLRENLDPEALVSDDLVLWHVLDQLELGPWLRRESSKGLDVEVSEAGMNLSLGQRQLVCIARAWLRPTKVVVFDEATANVALATDQVIQRTLRTRFQHQTVLTIAHRLETILHHDRVVVMDDGQVIECGAPEQLVAQNDPPSAFRLLVEEAKLI